MHREYIPDPVRHRDRVPGKTQTLGSFLPLRDYASYIGTAEAGGVNRRREERAAQQAAHNHDPSKPGKCRRLSVHQGLRMRTGAALGDAQRAAGAQAGGSRDTGHSPKSPCRQQAWHQHDSHDRWQYAA